MRVINRDVKPISLDPQRGRGRNEIKLIIHGFGPKRDRDSYASLSLHESRLLAYHLLQMAEGLGPPESS